MRLLNTAILALTIGLPQAVLTQMPLGGCAEAAPGSYYARLRFKTAAQELQTSDTFAVLQPGDEVRVCRTSGATAVITILQRGVGFRVRADALERLATWTRRSLSKHQRNCIARELDAIQREYGVDEQTRRILVLARKHRVSFFQLLDIRMDPYPRGPCRAQ